MICLDTMVLIWGVQGQARPGQEEMIDRTRRYLRQLRTQNEQIMIPTPALAEYLQGFAEEDRRAQLEVLERNFFIPAFNLPAAFVAAGISRDTGKVEGVSRQAVKTDVQIVATAIVHGATQIVTAEAQVFEKLAAGRVEVRSVPDVHEQQSLGFDA